MTSYILLFCVCYLQVGIMCSSDELEDIVFPLVDTIETSKFYGTFKRRSKHYKRLLNHNSSSPENDKLPSVNKNIINNQTGGKVERMLEAKSEKLARDRAELFGTSGSTTPSQEARNTPQGQFNSQRSLNFPNTHTEKKYSGLDESRRPFKSAKNISLNEHFNEGEMNPIDFEKYISECMKVHPDIQKNKRDCGYLLNLKDNTRELIVCPHRSIELDFVKEFFTLVCDQFSEIHSKTNYNGVSLR